MIDDVTEAEVLIYPRLRVQWLVNLALGRSVEEDISPPALAHCLQAMLKDQIASGALEANVVHGGDTDLPTGHSTVGLFQLWAFLQSHQEVTAYDPLRQVCERWASAIGKPLNDFDRTVPEIGPPEIKQRNRRGGQESTDNAVGLSLVDEVGLDPRTIEYRLEEVQEILRYKSRNTLYDMEKRGEITIERRRPKQPRVKAVELARVLKRGGMTAPTRTN